MAFKESDFSATSVIIVLNLLEASLLLPLPLKLFFASTFSRKLQNIFP
jgi:hypothetical protein